MERESIVPWGRVSLALAALLGLVALVSAANASTYVAYIPLDDPIYNQLDTLNGLGLLDTYLPEVKPISRVEAARLTREARRNLDDEREPEPLATALIEDLRAELQVEIGWLEENQEDDLPTMAHPVERLEMQYAYSDGRGRRWQTSQVGTRGECCLNAAEGTPLLPNNDGLATASGSNEIARLSGWVGAGSFLTGYAEGALAGSLTRSMPGMSRLQPVAAAAVASFGNLALSFGMEQMWWGVGYFNSLSQGSNASPFPAIRIQNIHPILLPSILRYMGQFRTQFVFGQMDDDRYYQHPYLFGQNFVFKPLDTVEFGLDHMIMFAGQHNNNYGLAGLVGRGSGFSTGSPAAGNTHSRGGIYFKLYFPKVRGSQLYFETMGQDNLTKEVPAIGRFLPFLSVSYLGGIYVPRLTEDGLTDLRFEFEYTDVNEEQHSDSLYWAYEGQLMGTSLGPNATGFDLEAGRWLALRDKLSVDLFYTQEAPYHSDRVPYSAPYYPYRIASEHSAGIAFDLLQMPEDTDLLKHGIMGGTHVRAAAEYAQDLNYQTGSHSMRFIVSVTGYLMPELLGWKWE